MTRRLVHPTRRGLLRRRRTSGSPTPEATPGDAFGLPAPESDADPGDHAREVAPVRMPPRGRRGGGSDPVGTRTLTATGRSSSRRARRQAVRAAAAAVTARTHAGDTDSEDALPGAGNRAARRWARWGRLARGAVWGPVGVATPAHVTSAARVGVLTSFCVPQASAIDGPIIGIEVTTTAPFTFDPWGVYPHLATSPCMLICGLQGSGKSYGTKVIMTRLVHAGRQVIVSSDPNGEWSALAGGLGGQVIHLGPGTGTVICPLDEGARPADTSAADWRRAVDLRRGQALESIVSVLRTSGAVDDEERTVLDTAVEQMGAGTLGATIAALVAWLDAPPAELIERAGSGAARRLSLVFSRLTRGPLAGMFDGASSTRLDPGAPMIAVNTMGLGGAGDTVRQIAAACTSAWIDTTLRSRDGRWRVVVSEEGWDELHNPAQARAMDDRIRLAGHLRCASVLIIHELKDVEIFGEAGSSHRGLVERVLSKCAIKVLYRQSSDCMAAVHRIAKPTYTAADLLLTLPQGQAIWCIGTTTPMWVQPVAGRTLDSLIDTDAGRTGR
ncbi:ATP-binding protein [Cellulomonas sp. RIT-PI-Y]|uniref:ATP-binding protein n=1 Tax=Cellulomonas sp. RIT-PI-Y TaxID=3035297 RepID=UPI0021D9F0BA|nr:ATP-binding protein [Cellulomonas sp. RIT-PI-Y]